MAGIGWGGGGSSSSGVSSVDGQTGAVTLSGTYARAPLTRALGKLFAGLATRDVAPCVVVFAGSSTTAGQNASIDALRYVNRFATALQTAYPRADGAAQPATVLLAAASTTPGNGIQVVNAGLGGTTSADYLDGTARTKIGTINPRAVVHMIGANDLSAQTSIATYKANIQANITALKAAISGPCAHLLVQPYQRYDMTGPFTVTWAMYGQALADLAVADPDNVAFVDISEPYALTGIPGADPIGLIDTDNLHQTDAGHALMTDLLWRAVFGGALPPPAAVAATPVVTIVSDTFNRTDPATNTLGSALTGQAWTSVVGNWGISSNQAGLKADAAGGLTTIDTGVTNCTVQVTVATPDSGAALVWRYTDVSNRYSCLANTGAVTMFKRVAGTTTQLATAAGIAAGDVVKVDVRGSTFTVYRNGVQVLQATDSALTAGTSVGLRADTAAGRFDNFTVVG